MIRVIHDPNDPFPQWPNDLMTNFFGVVVEFAIFDHGHKENI